MITKISIDDQLIDTAMALGNYPSKEETATVALEKYVERLKLQGILQSVRVAYDVAKVSRIDPREID